MLPGTKHSALIVIDMQNGFCNKGGSCDRIGLPVERLAPRRALSAAGGRRAMN
jgi:nicotinamidase-related amidase